jgi:hypothetical protein
MSPRKEGGTFRPIGKLKITGCRDFSYLQEDLREVGLLYDIGIDFYPYRQAQIELVEEQVSNLCPCALYVLNQGIQNVRETRKQLLEFGVYR